MGIHEAKTIQALLDNLSVEELKDVRTLAQDAITEKLSQAAHFTAFEFDPPDDRSYGTLSFTAETIHGVLQFKCMVGHDYTDDVKITLDGEKKAGIEFDLPDFGSSSDEAWVKQTCAEAVVSWASDYEPEEE